MGPRYSLALAVVAAALAGPGIARADYAFTPSTPANGQVIPYSDWIAGGRYITFTVVPDPNYPCNAFNEYYVEINGQRVARVGDGTCEASIYLATTGQYSWRVDLYIYNTATTVTGGQINSFTVAAETAASATTTTAPDDTGAAAQDTTPPRVQAVAAEIRVGKTATLKYYVADNSGSADVTLWIDRGSVSSLVWSADHQLDLFASLHTAAWRPKVVGTYRFCVSATDRQGNTSRDSCARIVVK
jgi:hypothetical protein